ncbi:hypothetical protein P280DRAFT_406353 [Massarina eburnea CBS 473.64]|uniref:Uncharacterized protein n=1 Tax=Massarina eburnea CBS 473.64 TaxID=1395130 RepID=A0A6A6RT15_9PLEO|nr:hypothetical protein P280DRAFT_406353 [Massarina eburnea CBS 473.64]
MARTDPAAVLHTIRNRYRVQAYLIMGHHFFLQSPMLLDIFVILFILVSNFMNRQHAVSSRLSREGIQVLMDQTMPVHA